MYCKLCGKEIPDGYVFCEDCEGMRNAEVQAPAVFTEPSFDEETPKKKKSKKGLLIALISTVVALALIAGAGFFAVKKIPTVRGMWVKNFGSGDEYFAFVEDKATENIGQEVSKFYGMYTNILDSVYTDINLQSKLELQISDELITLIQNYLPSELQGLDLSNYKNISFDMNVFSNDGKAKLDLRLNRDTDTLLDFSTVMDKESNHIYMGLTNLTDKYLVIEDALESTGEAANVFQFLTEIFSILPSEKVVNDMITEYVNYTIENIGTATKENDTIEINGKNQKVTVLTVNVTEGNLSKIIVHILEDLKGREEILTAIEELDKLLVKYEVDEYEEGELYKEFMTELQDEIDYRKDLEDSDSEVCTFIDYVNSKHEIVGRELEIKDVISMQYLTESKDGYFEIKIEIDEEDLNFTGTGNYVDHTLSGEFVFAEDEDKLFEIEMDRVHYSAEDGTSGGSIKIIPSADIISELVDMEGFASSLLSLAEPGLQITFNTEGKNSTVKYAIVGMGKEYVTLTATAKMGESAPISVPDTDSLFTAEEVIEWANTIDIDKVEELINNLKLPDSLSENIMSLVDAARSVGGIGNLINYVSMFS